VVHGRVFETVEALRRAVDDFVAPYNVHWRLEKNGLKSPDELRADFNTAPREGCLVQTGVQGIGCDTASGGARWRAPKRTMEECSHRRNASGASSSFSHGPTPV